MKIAIEFFSYHIHFVLVDAKQMLAMLKGIDDLGIVPENVIPRYCHSLFPKEDNIHDFINPWYDGEEIIQTIKQYVTW